MFKIHSIKFNNKENFKEYIFSAHSFIYGQNTRGKTALTIAIDYILGSSDALTYQGLDNIDSIEALLLNDKTFLWIKRTIKGNGYFYKRTKGSEYSEVSAENYKDNISLVITANRNQEFIDIYRKVFEENPTFRSFNFLNYIDEKGLGNLSSVFTKAKEPKHNFRIREIMNFFFNYENIEKIYEKEIMLESKTKEFDKLNEKYYEYNGNKAQQKKLFTELRLNYTGNVEKDYKTFIDFKDSYVRNAQSKSNDLVYLSKASFSLAEELKIYNFMKSQSKNMIDRRERIKRLLSIFKEISFDNPEYSDYIEFIQNEIKKIDDDNIILSLTDYNKTIRNIENEKEKLDSEISVLKASAIELSYEEAMKKVGILEHIFSVLKDEVDINRYNILNKEIDNLKKEIKELKSSFNQKTINKFNNRLTEAYFQKGLNVNFLLEDSQEEDFSLEFDPFKICVFAKHKKDGRIETYMPGSMARQTYIQMLVYLGMFEYLKNNFDGFIYMPVLVIDSANQTMVLDIFKKIYPVFIEMAEEVGIQTIFTSKEKLDCIQEEDLIDISNGLNPFHKA